ncbi:3-phosphoshikimate 1-carboxyvinyltransferase [Thalassoroseus pseudoceratinae]|uniref:3-phosphoshikimate 1-carboxyvinyltransferase n=1 Tax=Thalassoroseus pseudoceratinae TaxID=2713176 RepID=UPI001421126E|nr:3-phosphoshikimate 1-carboxyvinyltransferase [Thalassoroseus pseudoceratinae]
MLDDPLPINPVVRPISGHIRPPGSKSLTNRALIVAALAEGTSQLTGVLESTDTKVMIESLRRLGITLTHDLDACTVEIEGCRGSLPAREAKLYVENSGTSIRFLTALCATGSGRYELDGNSRMRERPIQDLVDTLNELGVPTRCLLGTDCPPLEVVSSGLAGGTAKIDGSVSSQYLSGLLMAAVAAREPIELVLSEELVSKPYVEMTLGVMARFDVDVERPDAQSFRIQPQKYRSTEFEIEPDASAASYFFAAAAISGGEVTVDGLSRSALQGDVNFVDALEQMGCELVENTNSLTVRGGDLRGIDIDMNAISDTAQTLATVAVFADGPTTMRNIGHVRFKETDRIAAVATELQRAGIAVETTEDSLTIHPGPVRPAVIQTYDDHRMAMSFSLLGLRAEGIEIADPGCTAKTYPRFFDDLATLTASAR